MCAVTSLIFLLGAADGAWLQRVPPADHARQNPFRGPQDAQQASAAGSQLFYNECAKCHGNDGMGKNGRPAVASDRIAHASDGDLFWLMTNGNPWRGMPPWNMLPVKQRWQLVSYLRALNNVDEPAGAVSSSADSKALPQ